MSGTIEALLSDMLTWLAPSPRSYAEVMDAWRTSCPRLTVWEDAVERGLIDHTRSGRTRIVRITPAGRRFLAERGVKLGGAFAHRNGSVHSQNA